MATLHIFSSLGRFHSFEEIRRFIDMTYTADGDGIPSPLIEEVKLSNYEPACIEAIFTASPTPLAEILARFSYADQWAVNVSESRLADSVICIFEPNEVRNPKGCSLEYCGA